MLHNDFRNPDLNRYADRVFEHEPRVDTVGDAHDAAEAQMYVDAIRELEGSFPDNEFVVVPKCHGAIEAVPDDIVSAIRVDMPTRLPTGFPILSTGTGVSRCPVRRVLAVDGWDDSGRDADHVSVRDTVRYGLNHVRSFWEAHGV